ncbi:glycosyltransferase family 2 protein [Thermoanaerobacterium thermosaccharolyticum]|uniref:glycosyltransferase family 2 protein n=1 Tax=Thermoanaerobacterium thermosaccharolyticum TaxID=1517 RepID=UPI003DA9A56C
MAIDNQKVAAVVVTFNRKNLLIECLDALLNQTYKLTSIIIIDNASTDGTYEILKEKGYLDKSVVDYVRLKENIGGAGGFHEGIKRGYEKGYDWLWIMDDDAEPKLDALEKLLNSEPARYKNTIGLTCLKVDKNGSIEKVHRGYYNFKKFKPEPLSDDMYSKEFCKVQYSSFVGLLIKSEAIKYAGLPESGFFIWFDDVEYCIRLSKVGDIFLIRDSVIKHKDNIINEKRLSINDYWKGYYGTRNTIILNLKHGNKFFTIFYSTYKLFRMLFGIFYFNDDHKFIRIIYLLKAYYDGIFYKIGKRIDPIKYKDELKRKGVLND